MSATPAPGSAGPARPDRRTLRAEVLLVFALSLGASALRATVSLIGSLTSGTALRAQTAVLAGSLAPGRPWLDLTRQLVAIGLSLVPVALAAHLLARGGESLRTIGLDGRRWGRDLRLGLVLAAVVGGTGLAFYLLVRAGGVNLTVVPSTLPDVWWRIPVLLLLAAQNAVLEEVLVAGYLLHRLRQLGCSDNRALVASAVLRGAYHLYQGFGGFVGNLVMGLLFGRVWQRTGRTTPLVVAHLVIDAVAFVGYALLAGRVSWLPAPT